MHDWKTMTYSRRDFGKMMLSSVPMATGFSTTFGSPGLVRALVARPDSVSEMAIRLGTSSFNFKELKKTVGEAQWPDVISDSQQ